MTIQTDDFQYNPEFSDSLGNLRFYQAFANRLSVQDDSSSILVTVTVGGLVVTGTMIGQKKYLRLTLDSLNKSSSNADTVKIVSFLPEMLIKVLEGEKTESFDTPWQDILKSKADTLYLENAILSPSANSIRVPLWEVPVSKIDGYCLGFTKES